MITNSNVNKENNSLLNSKLSNKINLLKLGKNININKNNNNDNDVNLINTIKSNKIDEISNNSNKLKYKQYE